MKPIDYKALYEDAHERAKQIKYGNPSSGTAIVVCEQIFPELAESEDERIRKALIDALKVSETIGELKFRLPYPTREECIAYLEKQKEQKPVQVNDDLIEIIKGEFEGFRSLLKKKGIDYEPQRSYWEGFARLFDSSAREYVKEQKPTDYCSVRDEFDLDGNLKQKPADSMSKEEYVKRFKALCNAYDIKLPNREYDIYGLCEDLHRLFGDADIQKPVEWSEEDKEIIDECIGAVSFAYADGETKTKCASFLQSLRSQSNHAEWSEEDEKMVRFYEADYNNQIDDMSMKDVINMRLEFKNWLVNRLKSLRPRPSWKPSEEQMSALLWCIAHLGGADRRVLAELYEHLKSLM